MKKVFKFFIFFILISTAVAVGYAAYVANNFLSSKSNLSQNEVVLYISQGSTFDKVAFDLKTMGAIDDVELFKIMARYYNSIGDIKAGSFLIVNGMTPFEVLERITKGPQHFQKLLIKEGLTWWETAKIIEEQGFAKYDDLKEIMHDKDFLKSNNIPFDSAEGFLYPDTYFLQKPRHLNKEQAKIIVSLLINTFWKKTNPLWEQIKQSNLETNNTLNSDTIKKYITIASLVEKETGVPEERKIVAGVFFNRLKTDMLLQCDPTIVYGIGENFKPPIRRSQIDDPKNMYNTYQHKGLPPGPIASPSYESIAAAINPDVHDFFYFVATGVDRGHSFSRTLKEHNEAVKAYRRAIGR